MVYFSCVRVRCPLTLVLVSLSLLAWAGAGCGSSDPVRLFDDAGADADAVAAVFDAGPLPLELDHGSVSIDFGPAACGGVAPAAREVSLKNVGHVPIVYRASLDSQASFLVTGGQSAVVPQGATAKITLIAQPVSGSATAGEVVRATLTLSDSYGHVPLTLPVTVTPHGGTLTVTTDPVAFGEVPLATRATEVPLTIKNTGNEPITVIVTAPADADFSVAWTGAPSPTPIAPGQTLAGAAARFRPSSPGLHQGEAVVVANGVTCGSLAPPKITLSGTGGTAVDAGADGPREASSDGPG